MRIHEQLVLGSFLRYLGQTLVGALVLFTLVDLFDHLGNLLDNHATAMQTVRYYVYKMPWIIDNVLPIAVLMATLFTVGVMARYLELTALYASGLSLIRVGRPILLAGAVLTLVALAWREYVLPEANVRMWRVWEVEIHGQPETMRPTRQIAATGTDGRLYFAHKFDPNSNEIIGLRVLSRHSALVTERLDAERAEWDGSCWVLHVGTLRRFEGDQESVEHFDVLRASDLSITPQGLYHTRVRQENMNIRQLLRHRDLVQQMGGNAGSINVDIQFQLAFPMVNLIVAALGLVLASGPRKTTIASGFGLTLLVGFGYYLLMMFGRSLGHSGVLPPVVAGWAGNLLYAIMTWTLFLRARR